MAVRGSVSWYGGGGGTSAVTLFISIQAHSDAVTSERAFKLAVGSETCFVVWVLVFAFTLCKFMCENCSFALDR